MYSAISSPDNRIIIVQSCPPSSGRNLPHGLVTEKKSNHAIEGCGTRSVENQVIGIEDVWASVGLSNGLMSA